MAETPKRVTLPQPETVDQSNSPKADPHDLESLTMDQTFAAEMGVKKLLTHVPVGKPGRHEWMRVHADPGYRGAFCVINLKTDREVFLVTKSMQNELVAECVPVTLYTAVSSRGIVRLWPVRLPGPDGKDLAWWSTERTAAEQAMTVWTRVMADMERGANEVMVSEKIKTVPKFPDVSFRDLLNIGFAGRIVDSVEHPIVRRLRGLE